MHHIAIIATIAAGLLAAGCVSNDSAEVKAELDGRLAESNTVYHGGCDQLGACALADRVCDAVGDNIVADLTAGTAAVLEWEAPDTVIGVRTYYYMIRPDGGGTYFSESRTDIADSDCGSYCGWHREEFAAGELFDGTALRLAPSGNNILDFALCAWP